MAVRSLAFVASVLLLSSACSSTDSYTKTIANPLAPTKTAAPAAPVAAVPVAPVAGPDGWVHVTPWLAWKARLCVEPCIVQYEVKVDNAPRVFHFAQPAAFHGDTMAGGPIEDPARARAWLRTIFATPKVAVGQFTDAMWGFDTRQLRCGRAQVDLSIVFDDDGSDLLVFGQMHTAHTDCGTIPHTPCFDSVTSASVDGNGLATFTVAPGGYVELSLVAYRFLVSFLPQQFVSGVNGSYSQGIHTLFLPGVAGDGYQKDLRCGGYVAEELTEANYAAHSATEIAWWP